jgi:hypothetical protein
MIGHGGITPYVSIPRNQMQLGGPIWLWGKRPVIGLELERAVLGVNRSSFSPL